MIIRGDISMARITDPSKIERIKKATMDLVVKYGYRGTSIGAIANEAEVSMGYLYRHYKGKSDLIEDLIEYNFNIFKDIFKSIAGGTTVKEIFYNITNILFDLAINYPIHAKFLCSLIFDQSFEIKKRKFKETGADKLVNTILELGIKNGEINPKITLQEIVLVLFTITFHYIAINLDEDNDKEKFTEKQARRVTEICLNALK